MRTAGKRNSKENKDTEGFTLAELLIVVAIIAVLVAVSIPILMHSLENTKKTVCESNRRTLVRQIVLERIEDDAFKDADAKKILEKSDAYCPAGGTYSVTMNDLLVKVECDKHGSSSAAADDAKISGEEARKKYLGDYRQFTIDYIKANPDKGSVNDTVRAAFYEKNGNKWPTLTVNNKTYYIQPFYQGNDTSKPVKDRVWLFAREDGSTANTWNVPFVYNVVDKAWYGKTDYNGNLNDEKAGSITKNDIADLDNMVKNSKWGNGKPEWIKLTDYQESY